MEIEQVLAAIRTGVVQLTAKYGLFDGEYSARLAITIPTDAPVSDELMQGILKYKAALYGAALNSFTTICPAEAEHRTSYRWVPHPLNEDTVFEVCDACVRIRAAQRAEIDNRT